MKNLTYILILGMNYCFAQAPNCLIPTPINQEIANILQPLDKNQIPNGILYESVFPWSALFDFDGSSTTDTTNTLHFIQAYNEIYNSAFNRIGLLHPNDLEEKLLNFHPDPTTHHPIGIIDFNYSRIKETAVTQNQLTVVNGQLHDVAGRTGSPYETETVFMAVPLLADGTSRFYTNTYHDFYLDSDFILSNNGFNLNDYEYIDIEINGALVHRENLSGSSFGTMAKDSSGLPKTKFLFRAFRVFFAAVTTVTAVVITIKLKKKIFGTKITRIDLDAEDLKELDQCNGLNQIFVTGDSYNGGYGQAAYAAKGRGYIFFGQGNCTSQQVKKPVIFVDGFDPNNARRVWDIFDGRINRSFTDINGQEVFMGDSLIKDGYDIIVYDYDEIGVNRGGAGFIENNALAFAKFLDSLYTRYSSTMEQDFIIVAPSMASLVVRYALAYMETNNLPHHVQTYISFDGPNQGAQIPLGIQQFVDLITQYGGLRIFDAAKFGFHQSNAAKQMLLHHSYTGSETVQAHPLRQKFLDNLALVGQYPQNLRKVAIVDGNRTGIKKSTPQPPPNQLILPSGKELELEITKLEDPTCTSNCDVVRIKTYAQTDNLRSESIDFKISRKARLFQLVFGGVGNHTEIKRYI
jgi:hypothetical protein